MGVVLFKKLSIIQISMSEARKLFLSDEDLKGPVKAKYEVFNRIFPDVTGTAERYDMDLFVTDEAGSYPGGLYEKSGNWAVGSFTPHGRRAKVIISDKAVNALTDLAFEGLVYHEVTRMLLFTEATRNSRVALRRMESMPRTKQDARVYFSVDRFFKTQGLVPFKVETGNIDYKEGKMDIGYWQEYLVALRDVLPENAAKILEGLEFKNEL